MSKLTQYALVLALAGPILLAPLYIVRWSYLDQYPTTLLELSIWFEAIVWGTYKVTSQKKINWPNTPILAPAILLLISGGLSILISPNLWSSLGVFRAYFLEPFIVFIVITDLLIEHRRLDVKPRSTSLQPHPLIWASLLGMTFWLAIVGVSQLIWHQPIFSISQINRVHGVFNNGNAFALLIGPILAVIFAQTLQKKITKLDLAVGTLGLLTFVGTNSLGGLIALPITVLAVYLSNRFFSRGLQLTLTLTVLTFAVLMSQISAITPTVANPWQRPGGTLLVRLCVWDGTAKLLSEHFITGTGLGGFQSAYSNLYYTCDAEPLVYPHNVFLNFWTETGLFGLVSMLLLLWIIFRQPQNKYTPFFVYFLIHGLIDVPYFKNDLALIFWVVLALWANQAPVGEGETVTGE